MDPGTKENNTKNVSVNARTEYTSLFNALTLPKSVGRLGSVLRILGNKSDNQLIGRPAILQIGQPTSQPIDNRQAVKLH